MNWYKSIKQSSVAKLYRTLEMPVQMGPPSMNRLKVNGPVSQENPMQGSMQHSMQGASHTMQDVKKAIVKNIQSILVSPQNMKRATEWVKDMNDDPNFQAWFHSKIGSYQHTESDLEHDNI